LQISVIGYSDALDCYYNRSTHSCEPLGYGFSLSDAFGVSDPEADGVEDPDPEGAGVEPDGAGVDPEGAG
jgi:hypothetical protein